jgi:hypothetical protein
MPGRAPTRAATSWLPSSWISTSPAWNAGPVHAQIERRRHAHGRHFRGECRAEAGLQFRQDPFRHFQPHGGGHVRVVQRAPFQRAKRRDFGGDQGRRAELAAGKGLADAVHGPAFQQQAGGHQQARRWQGLRPFQPPTEPAARADGGPGAVGHGAAVAGADEAAFAEEGVGGGVGRPARGGFDGFEQFDGAGEAGGGGHAGGSNATGSGRDSMARGESRAGGTARKGWVE